VGEAHVPLVPDALLPLVLEPADDVEPQPPDGPVAAQCDPRAGGDEVRHLAHRLEVLAGADDDGTAVAADGGPGRAELELDRGATARAPPLARPGRGHGGGPGRAMRRTSTRVAPRSSARRSAQAQSGRARQQ